MEKVISHPLYNGSSLDYDIALMKLRVPLNFSGKPLLWPSPSCSLSAPTMKRGLENGLL